MKTSIFLFSLLLGATCLNAQKVMVFVGTTDSDLVKSILTCELDEENSSLKIIAESDGGKRPGYITLSNDKRFLYAVSSAAFDGNAEENTINAFAVENNGKSLSKINEQSSKGQNPSHISVNPVKRFVYTANYGSGSVVSYSFNENGVLSEAVSSLQLKGSGPNPDRQKGPHAHFIHASNDGSFVYAADLGIDKIMIYRQDNSGRLIPNKKQEFLALTPGSGPRHLAFHKNNKWLFILTELSSEVISCKINSDGSLDIIDTQNTLEPGEPAVNNSAAAIRIHPNGKYLYCSNRGANTIALFEITENGKLQKKGSFNENIGIVRDFNISPSGNYLIAGNQDKNELILFKIDSEGALRSTGNKLSFSRPSCIVFY